jgi:hypothetical protein
MSPSRNGQYGTGPVAPAGQSYSSSSGARSGRSATSTSPVTADHRSARFSLATAASTGLDQIGVSRRAAQPGGHARRRCHNSLLILADHPDLRTKP